MRIIRLQAEGFKRLVAVDISPDGDLVEISGDNGEGKSSTLDAIFAALGGAAAAPIKPVRTGEKHAIIKLDLGDYKVTRYFGADGADSLKVESADGAKFTNSQTVLNGLIDAIAFDPLAFSLMERKEQAAELRRIVPLAVDLDKLADDDKADKATRRDINRDGRALAARLQAMPPVDVPDVIPDENALLEQIGKAAETNSAIERERNRRDAMLSTVGVRKNTAQRDRDRAQEIRLEAERLLEAAKGKDEDAAAMDKLAADEEAEIAALPALDEPVDVSAVQEKLREARLVAQQVEKARQRSEVVKELDALRVKSEGYTTKLAERAKLREEALAAAKMPVEGLSFAALPEELGGELIVTYQGEPFEQASQAQKIRVSAALAISKNPKLKVMIVKAGAFLDPKGMKLLADIATENGWQIWVERVTASEGGIVIENGSVKGAPEPEKLEAPKRRKPKGEGDPAVSDGNPASNEGAKINPADDDLIPEVVENVTTGETSTLFERMSGLANNAESPERPQRRRAMTSFTTKPREG